VEQNVSIEARLRRLEDIEAIQTLKARYCRYSDRGYDGAGDDPDEVAELFVADGEWQSGAQVVRGQHAIRTLFIDVRHRLPLGVHIVSVPEIVVEEDRAKATWYATIPVLDENRDTSWVIGLYADELVRTEAGWRFARMCFTTILRIPSSHG
jgi:hypothetical protein